MIRLGIPSHRRGARTDARLWVMLIFGIAFFMAASAIDPADNCSGDGRECAPWLVPIAQGLGALIAVGTATTMLANPNRDSFIDPATGDMVWWQHRIGSSGGDEGRIHPSQISRLRIVSHDDSDDEVHLYDREGNRLFSGSIRR